MIVGFTGTRNGMTIQQKGQVTIELQLLLVEKGIGNVVHGDCIGADEDFDRICWGLNIPRHIRPCTYEDMRAHCEKNGAKVIAEPINPMARNRAIIADCDVLIACPPNSTPIKRGSGTWATIRYGQKAEGVKVLIVLPNGEVERHE